MLIKTNEVAELLAVEEKVVFKWIEKEGLPATMVNGTYRMNRLDLLEWATDNNIKVPPQLFVTVKTETRVATLAEALEAGGIFFGVPGNDRLSVLRNSVKLINLPPQMDPDLLFQVLVAREAMGTTAIGRGIAIPHIRNPIQMNSLSPAISLCFLEQPVEFGALDGIPVKILFVLSSPNVKEHLHLLSRLAYALRVDSFVSTLNPFSNSDSILTAAKMIDQEISN